jgi:hypothetical protein
MASQPVQEIQLGLLQATIWKNANEYGVRYSVVIAKLYQAADRFEDTSHFDRDDLPLVSKLAELAHAWICEQKQKLIPPAVLCNLR